MLPVLFCLFIVVLIFIFILPYQIGIVLNILHDTQSFNIHFQSWQNFLCVEWTKKGYQTTIQFRLLNILINRRIVQFNHVHKRLMKEKSTQKKIHHRNWKRTVCIIRHVVSHSPELFCRFMRIFHFKDLSIRGDFSTGDPASTGIVYGLIQALCFVEKEHLHLSIMPHFQEKTCEGTVRLIFCFMLMPLLWWVACAGIRFMRILRTCHF